MSKADAWYRKATIEILTNAREDFLALEKRRAPKKDFRALKLRIEAVLFPIYKDYQALQLVEFAENSGILPLALR